MQACRKDTDDRQRQLRATNRVTGRPTQQQVPAKPEPCKPAQMGPSLHYLDPSHFPTPIRSAQDHPVTDPIDYITCLEIHYIVPELTSP